jgi:hypothetical protein
MRILVLVFILSAQPVRAFRAKRAQQSLAHEYPYQCPHECLNPATNRYTINAAEHSPFTSRGDTGPAVPPERWSGGKAQTHPAIRDQTMRLHAGAALRLPTATIATAMPAFAGSGWD